jgi:hypothetical protein
MNENARGKKRFAFTLEPGESVGAGLLRVVDALAQSVDARGAAPTPGQGEAVHAIRITIKRLRAILRLVRPGIGETVFEQENARLRKAAHRLSLARDRQVARKTLLALSLSNKHEQEAAATVLAGLEAVTGLKPALSRPSDESRQIWNKPGGTCTDCGSLKAIGTSSSRGSGRFTVKAVSG